MEKHDAPIIIISGAMGSGKGTIIHALVHELRLTWVPTHTTRPMRADDSVISHRVFDTEVNFLRHLDRGEILVPAKVAGNYYGLLKSDLDNELRHHRPLIIELTPDGGAELARHYPNCLLFFVHTSKESMLARTEHRQMDDDERQQRLRDTAGELALAKKHFDYLIENVEGHPEEAIETIKDLICERFPEIHERVAEHHHASK